MLVALDNWFNKRIYDDDDDDDDDHHQCLWNWMQTHKYLFVSVVKYSFCDTSMTEKQINLHCVRRVEYSGQ